MWCGDDEMDANVGWRTRLEDGRDDDERQGERLNADNEEGV